LKSNAIVFRISSCLFI